MKYAQKHVNNILLNRVQSTQSSPILWYRLQGNLNDSIGTNHGILSASGEIQQEINNINPYQTNFPSFVHNGSSTHVIDSLTSITSPTLTTPLKKTHSQSQ